MLHSPLAIMKILTFHGRYPEEGRGSGGLDCSGNYKLLYVSLEKNVQTPSKINWSLGFNCFSRDVRTTLCEIV